MIWFLRSRPQYHDRSAGDERLRGIPGLLGMRGSFRRLRDDCTFYGWVEHMTSRTVMMRLAPGETIQQDDSFHFLLCGVLEQAEFHARFSTVRPLESSRADFMRLDQGVMIAVKETSLEFKITSVIEFRAAQAEAQKYAQSQAALLQTDVGCDNTWIVDVSRRGAGVICDHEVPVGTQVVLHLIWMGREMHLPAVARQCEPFDLMDHAFRVGLEFGGANRIDQAMWHQYFNAA